MITDDELRKVAKLVKIKLSEEDLSHMASEVSKILDFAETLSEVDCTGVEPSFGGTIDATYEREDVVTDGNIEDTILPNAPAKKYNMFSVPKVVE